MKKGFAVAVAVVAFCVALFVAWSLASPLPEPGPTPPPAVTAPPLPEPAPAPAVEPEPEPTTEPAPVEAPVAEPPAAEPDTLTVETLKGTAWEREGFRIDLAEDGKVLIGNRTPAKWTVEGSRLKLYNDTGEVHYLDIRGKKLFWENQEIGRVQP